MSNFPTATSAIPGPLITASLPAITTTFVPPPQCTENHLTMLGNQKDELWLNAPMPVPNVIVNSCYPAEFANNIVRESQETLFIPEFHPLVCPENYNTVFTTTFGYFACCPRYGLQSSYPKQN